MRRDMNKTSTTGVGIFAEQSLWRDLDVMAQRGNPLTQDNVITNDIPCSLRNFFGSADVK
jgi:hypothetical protein